MTDYERIKREYDLSVIDRIYKKMKELPTLDDIWPVGSIYMSLDKTDPSIRFGGTWERIRDTFLLAAGDVHSAGESGGEEEHILMIDEVPRVSFNVPHIAGYNQGDATGYSGTNMEHSIVANTNDYEGAGNPLSGAYWHHLAFGANGSHNNMPPYLVVYVWKRIK